MKLNACQLINFVVQSIDIRRNSVRKESVRFTIGKSKLKVIGVLNCAILYMC